MSSMEEVLKFDLYGLENYVKENKISSKVLISVFRGNNFVEEIVSDVCLPMKDVMKYLKKFTDLGIISVEIDHGKKVNFKKNETNTKYTMSDHVTKHQYEIYDVIDF